MTDAVGLAAQWREEAANYRRRGQENVAHMAESYASDLEAWWREWWHEELTYAEAERETGVPRSTLEKKVRGGQIPNVGENCKPRFRRCDLFPGLAGTALSTVDEDSDFADKILANRLAHRTG
jgi:hypothetical protein